MSKFLGLPVEPTGYSDPAGSMGFLSAEAAKAVTSHWKTLRVGRSVASALRSGIAHGRDSIIEIDANTIATLLEGLVALRFEMGDSLTKSGWSQAANNSAEAKRELLGCRDLVVEMVQSLVDVVGIDGVGHDEVPTVAGCVDALAASRLARMTHRLSGGDK